MIRRYLDRKLREFAALICCGLDDYPDPADDGVYDQVLDTFDFLAWEAEVAS